LTSPPLKPTPPPIPARRFPHLTLRGWLGIFALLILLIVAGIYLFARMTPSWYEPLDAGSTAVMDDADVAQNKIRFEIHNTMERVPLGPQEWRITQHQIDSLLAIRFAPTPDAATAATSKAAAIISSPFVLFSSGKVTVAARSPKIPGDDPNGGVVSVSFVVETTTGPDGSPMGVIHIDSASVGWLPIPKSLVESKLKSMLPSVAAVAQQTITYQLGVHDSAALMPQIETVIRAVSDGEPFPLRFRYDRRDVLIQEIRVDDGSLSIVFAPPSELPPSLIPR